MLNTMLSLDCKADEGHDEASEVIYSIQKLEEVQCPF
jgi:hypothetical protein